MSPSHQCPNPRILPTSSPASLNPSGRMTLVRTELEGHSIQENSQSLLLSRIWANPCSPGQVTRFWVKSPSDLLGVAFQLSVQCTTSAFLCRLSTQKRAADFFSLSLPPSQDSRILTYSTQAPSPAQPCFLPHTDNTALVVLCLHKVYILCHILIMSTHRTVQEIINHLTVCSKDSSTLTILV